MGENLPERDRQMRASDADRDRVVEQLRDATAEGRLTMEEFDERMERAYAARTQAELVPLTDDLPTSGTHPVAGPPTAVSGPEHHLSVSVLGNVTRAGVFQPGREHRAIAVLGDVVIDLRHQPRDTVPHIAAVAILGTVTVIVRPETPVQLSPVSILGDVQHKQRKRFRDLPAVPLVGETVRIDGVALLGTIQVRREPVSAT